MNFLFSNKSINSINKLIVLVLFFGACNNDGNKHIVRQQTSTDTSNKLQNLHKPPSSFSDTLIITGQSAVFYNPDSVQLNNIKADNKEMIFKSLMHDCYYQMKNARIVLKKYWPQIRIIETSKARYLSFVYTGKKKVVFDLNKKNDICGIFLFDPPKDPILIDMMNIDTELGFYFKKP